MADRSADRAAAAYALGRLVTSPEGRQLFKLNGYPNQSRLVLVLESDPLRQVFDRARHYAPPVTAAVYYPSTGRLRFMTFEPTSTPGDEQRQVGADTTIGMLIDTTAGLGESRFDIYNGWVPMRVREFATA